MSTSSSVEPIGPVCERCGQVHDPARCTAHVRLEGGGLRPCKRRPSRGLHVCTSHGGGTSRSKTAARRRLAQEEAQKSIRDVVVTPIDDPLDKLAEIAAMSVAWMEHLANVVAELKASWRFTDDKGAEQLDARVQLYERAMDRSHKFLADWVRLGFEDRKVRLDEARLELVHRFLAGVLAELGLQLEDARVRTVLERWVPVLDGDPVPVLEVREVAS